MNLTAAERRWIYWALGMAVAIGAIAGLLTAPFGWRLLP